MNPEAAQRATAFLAALAERCARQDDADSVARFGEAYRRLIDFARAAPPAELDAMQGTLATALVGRTSNWEFGCIANTCGFLVELGSDPGIALEPILDRISRQIERVPEFVEIMQTQLGVAHPNSVAEDDWPRLGRDHPDAAWVIGEWFALRGTGCAAMTMLCRDVETRQRARQRIDLMQRVEAARSDNPYAYYLAETLGMIDNERLLVLDMTRRLGFRVHLTAIRNNFHLFTLLQDAVLSHPSARHWHGPQTRPLAVALAKSERMLPEIAADEWAAQGESDSAIWTYYPGSALKPDGTFTPMHWIWGEGKPTDIPALDGERVMLIGPLETPRSWSLGFFAPLHPALRSAVRIEGELTPVEFDDWMRKLVK